MKIRFIRRTYQEEEDYHRMRYALWSHHSEQELRDEMTLILIGDNFYKNELSWTVLVAVRDNGSLGGFIEITIYPKLESYEESPIGYIEGWYVDPDLRKQGVGRDLVKAAEAYVKEAGCKAIASDVEHHNRGSQKAHVALGFEATHEDQEGIFYYKSLS